MKNRTKKGLWLNKRTIASLNKLAMELAKGGVEVTATENCCQTRDPTQCNQGTCDCPQPTADCQHSHFQRC